MKPFLFFLLFSFLNITIASTLYRGTDSNGNIIYSQNPNNLLNPQKITLNKPSIISSSSPPIPSSPPLSSQSPSPESPSEVTNDIRIKTLKTQIEDLERKIRDIEPLDGERSFNPNVKRMTLNSSFFDRQNQMQEELNKLYQQLSEIK